MKNLVFLPMLAACIALFISCEKSKDPFIKKAEEGDAEAQYNLGLRYEYGKGVQQDIVEAVKWYQKAAEQGNAMGQGRLGWMYGSGRGVTQDYAEAIKWLRKAAEQGDTDAQLYLGWLYKSGLGVPRDYISACMWYGIAASNGSEGAGDLLEITEMEMTSDDIEEAQRRAQTCFQSNYEQCD
jgi:TPR repeat protein